jgi:hypothetical protein
LTGPFGRLEYLICETLESLTVLRRVLSLGMEGADVIQDAFKFTRPEPILLMASWPLHHTGRMVRFPLLVIVTPLVLV